MAKQRVRRLCLDFIVYLYFNQTFKVTHDFLRVGHSPGHFLAWTMSLSTQDILICPGKCSDPDFLLG